MVLANPAASAFVGPAHASAASGRFTLLALNPAIPSHVAVMRWHHALLSSDFDTWFALQPPIAPHPNMRPISPGMWRMIFDQARKNVPSKLFITAAPDSIGPNGAADFVVVGCTRLAGDSRDIRLVAGVTLRKIEGQWKVFGSAFGPPWTNKVRVCPVVPGPN